MDLELFDEIDRVERRHWWFAARRKIVRKLIRRFRPRPAGRPLEICDIGCGTGANLPMLRRFGQVWAVDPCPYALNMAEKKKPACLHRGSLPDELPFVHERFDVITLTDVLEHIREDAHSVRRCAELLAPGGIVVATVPAYQWLWTRRDNAHGHYRRYTLESFGSLFAAAGLRVELASYCNSMLFPLMAVERICRRLWPERRQGVALPLPAPPINAFFRSVFVSERLLLGTVRLPFGGSVVCVARARAAPAGILAAA